MNPTVLWLILGVVGFLLGSRALVRWLGKPRPSDHGQEGRDQ